MSSRTELTREADSPLRGFVKEVGWLLLMLNAACAAYALLIGLTAGGFKEALLLFVWGSLLVTGGIATLAALNVLYVKVQDRFRSKRR